MADIFQATYSDWKVIRGRKVVQIVVEVPIEYSDDAYLVLGGMPNPAEEVWVGVARLDPKVGLRDRLDGVLENPRESQPTTAEADPHHEKPASDIPVRANPYPKRAAILCNDIRFQKFLAERYGIIPGPDAAATKVRELCEVISRKDIYPGTAAADRFDILESAYRVEDRV